jgi:hypothetical protein
MTTDTKASVMTARLDITTGLPKKELKMVSGETIPILKER